MSEKYDSGSERDIIIKLKSGLSGYVLPSPVLLYTRPREKTGAGGVSFQRNCGAASVGK